MKSLEGEKWKRWKNVCEISTRGGDTDTNCAIYGAIRGYSETLELDLNSYLDKASQTILHTL